MPKTKSASEGKRQRRAVTGPQGVAGAMSTEGLLDLAQKLGLTDILTRQIKDKIQEQDFEELAHDAREYLSRNPEVLVISLGALTIATGMVVWLHQRREWDGYERRGLQEAS